MTATLGETILELRRRAFVGWSREVALFRRSLSPRSLGTPSSLRDSPLLRCRAVRPGTVARLRELLAEAAATLPPALHEVAVRGNGRLDT